MRSAKYIVRREAPGGAVVIGGESVRAGDRVVTDGNLLLNELLTDEQPEASATAAMAKSS